MAQPRRWRLTLQTSSAARARGLCITHGLTATHFILITEDINDFNEFRQTYITRYGPATASNSIYGKGGNRPPGRHGRRDRTGERSAPLIKIRPVSNNLNTTPRDFY